MMKIRLFSSCGLWRSLFTAYIVRLSFIYDLEKWFVLKPSWKLIAFLFCIKDDWKEYCMEGGLWWFLNCLHCQIVLSPRWNKFFEVSYTFHFLTREYNCFLNWNCCWILFYLPQLFLVWFCAWLVMWCLLFPYSAFS